MSIRLSARWMAAALVGATSFLLAACSGSGDAPRDTVVPDEAGAASSAMEAASGTALTPDYLEGTWCFAYTDLGKGNREEQGVEYVFNADGTLSYQRSPDSEKLGPGSYEVTGDMIDLRPMFMVFDLRIDSVEQDEFVLKGMGRHHFIRGVCPE